MRVALLTPRFWPEVRRGGERLVHDLAVGLRGHGHEARILTSRPGLRGDEVEVDGVPVVRVPRPPDGRLERRRFEHHLTHVPFANRALARGEDEVAHAFYPTDALAAARWRARTGRPAVLSYLGIPHRVGLVHRRRRLEITQRAIAGCSAVTALSRPAADAFARWLGVQARVVHPGVDLHAFAPAGERAPEPTILCASDAGEPRKRVGLLVEAFARVRRRHPRARLELSGPVDPGLAAQPGVEVVDLDRHADLVAAYRRAWVTAAPAALEAFGLVLLESLACATPVVGADDGGAREIVDRPDVGRTFPADGGPDALAAALLEVLEAERHPAACRARAEDFSLDRCLEAHVALYAELIDNAGHVRR